MRPVTLDQRPHLCEEILCVGKEERRIEPVEAGHRFAFQYSVQRTKTHA